MNSSEIIQLFGMLYFILGLAFIFNKKYYKSIFSDMVTSTSFLLFSGIFAFIFGFIILINFNNFGLTKDGLVAIIGLISFVKGLFILLFPNDFTKLSLIFTKKKYFKLITFAITVIGLGLMYLGFVV